MSAVDSRVRDLLDHPVVRTLRAAAGETHCHLVGGALRDRLLGLPSDDLDAVVAGGGPEIAARMARRLPARLVRLGGRRFAAFRLVGAGFTLDLWDRRDGSLRDDLARRDFTINAFALDLADGRLADPFGGLDDLRRRLLRATTPRVFEDDPLRVLRLVRLASQLPGFRPEPSTLALARRSVASLTSVAAERVREELDRILAAADFVHAFDLLAALGLFPALLQGSPTEEVRAPAGLRPLRLQERRLAAIAARDLPGAGRPDRPAARLALLFRLLPLAGRAEVQGALERCRRAGYLTGAAAARCRRLVAADGIPEGQPARRRFLNRWGELWPTAMAHLAAAADRPLDDRDWEALTDEMALLAGRLGDAVFAPPPLLDGHEIQALLGIGPGPRVGEVARLLLRAQVEGEIRTRAAAEAAVRKLASGADSAP